MRWMKMRRFEVIDQMISLDFAHYLRGKESQAQQDHLEAQRACSLNGSNREVEWDGEILRLPDD